jgi:hypothetical protein
VRDMTSPNRETVAPEPIAAWGGSAAGPMTEAVGSVGWGHYAAAAANHAGMMQSMACMMDPAAVVAAYQQVRRHVRRHCQLLFFSRSFFLTVCFVRFRLCF